MAYELEHYLSLGQELGEGPLWSVEEQALYWVDIFAGNIHRHKPSTEGYETWNVGQPVGSIGFRQGGGFIVSLKNGLHIWKPGDDAPQFIENPEAHKPHVRYNDGAVDRAGRYWTGTMDDNGESCLYRFAHGQAMKVCETGIMCSNGIGWSPDNKTMYYSDSQRFNIYAYDFDLASGELANRRVFLRPEQGEPDGLTVDSEGCVWVAMWDGWRVDRYDPEGKLMLSIPTPVQYPTCPIFGGPNMDEIFITSAWLLLGKERRHEQPQAGDMFHIQTDIKGIPEPKFAG
jgi:sugar lactone lactonase YvrE